MHKSEWNCVTIKTLMFSCFCFCVCSYRRFWDGWDEAACRDDPASPQLRRQPGGSYVHTPAWYQHKQPMETTHHTRKEIHTPGWGETARPLCSLLYSLVLCRRRVMQCGHKNNVGVLFFFTRRMRVVQPVVSLQCQTAPPPGQQVSWKPRPPPSSWILSSPVRWV